MNQPAEIFDPRDNTMKPTDNPALIVADLIDRGFLGRHEKDETFWLDVIHLANICDETVGDSKNEDDE